MCAVMTRKNTRQVGQLIRHGTLPEYADGGYLACRKHGMTDGKTEMLRWQKGSKIYCAQCAKWVPALVCFPLLGVEIDCR